MNRAYKLGMWTFSLGGAMAFGCGFNAPTPVDPPPVVAPQQKPVFDGEAISAKVAPAAIAGGTLLIAKQGTLAFAANPDGNSVDVIDLAKRAVVWNAELGEGAEPGRMAEDASGKVLVVLRRAGAIATLDFANRTIARRPVCAAPRGITINAGVIRVACQGGELLSISESGTTSAMLDRDLRDIVVRENGSMFVSRFRSAEVLDLDANGNVVGRMAPRSALDRITDPDNGKEIVSARFQADVAWRSAPASDGSLYVLHQYATTRSVAIKPSNKQVQNAPYGGGGFGDPCGNSKLVVPALTRIASGEAPRTMRLNFDAPGFDMAISSTGRVAVAGANRVTSFVPSFPSGEVQDCSPQNGSQEDQQGSVATEGQPIAVAFAANDQLIIQTRDPAQLIIADSKGTGFVTKEIDLSPSTHDTGFKVFHTPTQVGIACVSCHPEGGDDGHVWNFTDLGPRRSQSLRGGIMQTAPFHWGGDMANVSQLAHDVFTDRMGGLPLTEPQVGVLASWIDRQPALATVQRAPDAVQRGQALFATSGCTTCHSGQHMTNNQNADVGTGGEFQVPSLVGVSARAPFMHDGCASSLMDRFTNVACGGAKHGETSKLDSAQLSDLVSYLETL